MSNSGADRWLIGIVVGAIVLIGIAVGVVLTRAPASFIDDSIPEGVAHNYLLAVQQDDHARAYSYLSPALPNYPIDVEAYYDTIRAGGDRFLDNGKSATTVRDSSYFSDDRATVRVEETTFYGNGLFESNQSTYGFDMELARIDGAWKLIDGDNYRYWRSCWSDATDTCPTPLPSQETP